LDKEAFTGNTSRWILRSINLLFRRPMDLCEAKILCEHCENFPHAVARARRNIAVGFRNSTKSERKQFKKTRKKARYDRKSETSIMKTMSKETKTG
jgi:hypothetical protein